MKYHACFFISNKKFSENDIKNYVLSLKIECLRDKWNVKFQMSIWTFPFCWTFRECFSHQNFSTRKFILARKTSVAVLSIFFVCWIFLDWENCFSIFPTFCVLRLKIDKMNFYLLYIFVLLLLKQYYVNSLKCFLTGYPFPKNCSIPNYDKLGTSLACLSAVVLDGEKIRIYSKLMKTIDLANNFFFLCEEYKKPAEIRECSKVPVHESPGGEVLFF